MTYLIRRVLAVPAVLAVAVVLQVSLVNRLPLPGDAAPDLVLLVALGFAVAGGPVPGMLAGFLGGLALDVAPPGSDLAGENALVFCLVGYGCGALAAQARSAGESQPAALVTLPVMAAGLGLGEALRGGLGMMLSDPSMTVPALKHVLPAAIVYDLLLAPFVALLAAVLWGAPDTSRAAFEPSPAQRGPARDAIRAATAGAVPRLGFADARQAPLRAAGRPDPKLSFSGAPSSFSRTPASPGPALGGGLPGKALRGGSGGTARGGGTALGGGGSALRGGGGLPGKALRGGSGGTALGGVGGTALVGGGGSALRGGGGPRGSGWLRDGGGARGADGRPGSVLGGSVLGSGGQGSLGGLARSPMRGSAFSRGAFSRGAFSGFLGDGGFGSGLGWTLGPSLFAATGSRRAGSGRAGARGPRRNWLRASGGRPAGRTASRPTGRPAASPRRGWASGGSGGWGRSGGLAPGWLRPDRGPAAGRRQASPGKGWLSPSRPAPMPRTKAPGRGWLSSRRRRFPWQRKRVMGAPGLGGAGRISRERIGGRR